MQQNKPIKKWNICFKMCKNCIKVIEEFAITDLDISIKQCKELRIKFPDRLWNIELNKIED